MNQLTQLAEKAKLAHYGTSFTPEERGVQMIKEYEAILAADLELIKGASSEIKEQYRDRFITHLGNYMNARARIVSPMIAGPANFPTRKMEKYRNWEHSAYDKFKNFREKALHGIQSQIEKDKPAQQRADEAWASIEKELLWKIAGIIDVDNGGFGARSLLVSNLTGFIKRMAANGQTDHVKKAIELIRENNKKAKKPIVTERNEIFKLVDLAQKVEQAKEEKANKEPDIYPFDGGQVIINYSEQRIQLKYDTERVPNELYQKLTKELHFRHSRTNKAFQLYINNQSIYKVNQFLGLNIPGIKG